MACVLLGEGIEDLLPDTGFAPALVAGVDRLPGTELIRHVSPGGASLDHPQHASQDGAVFLVGATTLRLLWWEQLRDAVPPLIRELKVAHSQRVGGGRSERWCLLPGPSPAMTCLGDRLVAAAKDRPVQPEVKVLG